MGRDVETFALPGFDVTLLDAGAEATLSAQEWHASAGAGGIPVHAHHQTEEAFYVVGGALAFWRDDQSDVHQQGSYIVVPPGQPHAFWNPAVARRAAGAHERSGAPASPPSAGCTAHSSP